MSEQNDSDKIFVIIRATPNYPITYPVATFSLSYVATIPYSYKEAKYYMNNLSETLGESFYIKAMSLDEDGEVCFD